MNNQKRISICYLSDLIRIVLISALVASTALAQDEAGPADTSAQESVPEDQSQWEYFVPVTVPPAGSAPATDATQAQPLLVDMILGPSVYSFARFDLADLRLYDKSGAAVPYALRELRPQSQRDRVSAEEFNRNESDTGAIEVSLDLHREDIQHNAIEIVISGQNFRRSAEVEGSDDGKTWRPLATGHLLRYAKGEQKLEVTTLEYSPSRFRYVRVRVAPDPDSIMEGRKVDKFQVEMHVLQRVDLAGQILMLDAELGKREPTRTYSAPGSAWIIDLGGERIPCDRIEVDIADSEFARDIQIQYELPHEPGARIEFVHVALNETLWQRKAGEAKRPMVAEFSEVQTGRLKLTVTDHRNPPLSIRSVKFGAPVRQLVFARPASGDTNLQLFFGNPRAEPPNYDFARSLSLALPTPPVRAKYSAIEPNPSFVLPPKAFTERFPWLIYVVLSCVAVVLGVVIISLSRTAITIHDAQAAPAQ